MRANPFNYKLISLHLMLDAVQPLEYETGLLIMNGTSPFPLIIAHCIDSQCHPANFVPFHNLHLVVNRYIKIHKSLTGAVL